MRTVLIGSDHAGYELKESLKRFLQEQGYAVVDVG
ncbi:MAG: ribose-5-phosphate isomerase, partial [Armatimonadota bacterium]